MSIPPITQAATSTDSPAVHSEMPQQGETDRKEREAEPRRETDLKIRGSIARYSKLDFIGSYIEKSQLRYAKGYDALDPAIKAKYTVNYQIIREGSSAIYLSAFKQKLENPPVTNELLNQVHRAKGSEVLLILDGIKDAIESRQASLGAIRKLGHRRTFFFNPSPQWVVEIDLQQIISAGQMKELYRGWDYFTGQPFAILKISKSLMRPDDSDECADWDSSLLNEELLSERLASEGVPVAENMGSVRWIADGKWNTILINSLKEASLTSVIREGHLISAEKWEVARQLASTVEKCHKLGYLLRDIKPDNFVMKGKNIYLIDLSSLIKTDDEEGSRRADGTFTYFSPQLAAIYHTCIKTGHFAFPKEASTPKVDIFALGITLFELFTKIGQQDQLFDTFKVDETVVYLERVAESNPSEKVDSTTVDPRLKPLLKAMLEREQKDRPDAFEVLSFLEAVISQQKKPVTTVVEVAGDEIDASLPEKDRKEALAVEDTPAQPPPACKELPPTPLHDDLSAAADDPSQRGLQ